MPEFVIDPATIVALLALAGTTFTLIANRRRSQAEAHKSDAEAVETLADATKKIVEMHIAASEARCEELMRQAVKESEERCEERAEKRKLERDKELADLKAWGELKAAEACEERQRLRDRVELLVRKLADERELLAAREEELAQIVRDAEAMR